MKTNQPVAVDRHGRRHPRSDRGKPQLTSRDLDILCIIGEQTAYRFDQLQGLLARHPQTQSTDPDTLSETRTMAIIRRWQSLGLADYRKILHDQPGWTWLTAKGLAHLGLALRFHEPAYADLEHLYWINETRALVEATYGSHPGFHWESERQFRATRERLKAQQKQESHVWIPQEYQGTHRPDAVVRYRLDQDPEAPEMVSAIEVELSEKSIATWEKIFLDLTFSYAMTHYYVDPSIKKSLHRALEHFQSKETHFGSASSQQHQSIVIHDLQECL